MGRWYWPCGQAGPWVPDSAGGLCGAAEAGWARPLCCQPWGWEAARAARSRMVGGVLHPRPPLFLHGGCWLTALTTHIYEAGQLQRPSPFRHVSGPSATKASQGHQDSLQEAGISGDLALGVLGQSTCQDHAAQGGSWVRDRSQRREAPSSQELETPCSSLGTTLHSATPTPGLPVSTWPCGRLLP